jgi:hypothetical protein
MNAADSSDFSLAKSVTTTSGKILAQRRFNMQTNPILNTSAKGIWI